MSVRQIKNFRHYVEPEERWGVYVLAMRMPDDRYLVKIGRSSNPIQRYASLLPGIAFPSMMKWAPVRSIKVSLALERFLHETFREENTAREWFLFDESDKERLSHELTQAWIHHNGMVPDWWVLNESNASSYSSHIKKKRKSARH